VGLHACVSVVIRLISRFQISLLIKHVLLLWHVPVLGLFCHTVPSAILRGSSANSRSNSCCSGIPNDSFGLCLRASRPRRCSCTSSSGSFLCSSPTRRIQDRKLPNDLSIGPLSFSLMQAERFLAKARFNEERFQPSLNFRGAEAGEAVQPSLALLAGAS